MREMGFEVSFIGPTKDGTTKTGTAAGFPVKYIPYPSGTKAWIKYITTFVETKEIESANPDYVVLYNFPAIASLKIIKYCHKHGIQVIHDVTEWESEQQWNARALIRRLDILFRMRYCIKKCDGVIAISRYLFDYYRKFVHTILVPPTIDLKDEKWERKRSLTVGSPIRLVYAGTAGVGQKDRLDLIIREVSKSSQIQLDIIGMTKEQYESSFGQLPKPSTNIAFHGRVPHKVALEAVKNADFQFLIRDDNLKNNAGFPTKLVESMACGTPLIATLTSNIGDYIKDGENGFIVSKSNSLEKVLEKITLIDKNDVMKMKRMCRESSRFDYRNYKKELGKIFYNE
jgi:glycosyltransferase involved in cell wall biosynthesis